MKAMCNRSVLLQCAATSVHGCDNTPYQEHCLVQTACCKQLMHCLLCCLCHAVVPYTSIMFRDFPNVNAKVVSATAHQILYAQVIYPAAAYINTTFVASSSPVNALLREMRAAGTLLPHRFCDGMACHCALTSLRMGPDGQSA